MDRLKKSLFVFKMIYLLYLLLAFNAFVNGMPWMNLATYGIAAVGGILCIWMLLYWKKYRKTVAIILLGLFMLSYMVSAVTHISCAGITENAKGFIWMVLPIILVYASAFAMNREEMNRELACLSGMYVVYCTIANAVGLGMIVWGRNYDYTDSVGTVHPIGYRWGRLWGIYDDPNHGATISAIAIFLLIYLYGKARKLWQKILIVICGIIQYAYIIFSDSRTGILCLTAVVVLYMFLQIVRNRHSLGNKILILAIVIVVIFAGDVALKAAYAPLDAKLKKLEVQNVIKPTTNDRKQNLKKDYSNGRIELWTNGIEIVETTPVIGVGYRNMNGYAQRYFPDSYMVKNASGVQYDSMHNLEMDVLVSQGIIGMILFVAIFGCMFWRILQKLPVLRKEKDNFIILMIASSLALGAAATFLSFIFYVNAPQNFCFWLFLGYGMRALTEEKGA